MLWVGHGIHAFVVTDGLVVGADQDAASLSALERRSADLSTTSAVLVVLVEFQARTIAFFGGVRTGTFPVCALLIVSTRYIACPAVFGVGCQVYACFIAGDLIGGTDVLTGAIHAQLFGRTQMSTRATVFLRRVCIDAGVIAEGLVVCAAFDALIIPTSRW
jgi:hypothetical protein